MWFPISCMQKCCIVEMFMEMPLDLENRIKIFYRENKMWKLELCNGTLMKFSFLPFLFDLC